MRFLKVHSASADETFRQKYFFRTSAPNCIKIYTKGTEIKNANTQTKRPHVYSYSIQDAQSGRGLTKGWMTRFYSRKAWWFLSSLPWTARHCGLSSLSGEQTSVKLTVYLKPVFIIRSRC